LALETWNELKTKQKKGGGDEKTRTGVSKCQMWVRTVSSAPIRNLCTINVFRENSIAKFLKPKTYWSHRKTNPDYILIQVEKQPNFLI
jgi:hypothetical protein